ncbi:TPA: hypothetical protein ACH3X3_008204 [Trebouxia sp. C0006]
MALMHVTYTGEEDTELMSAQDIWTRKYHELWEKLEKNTKHSFSTALWKWLVMLNLSGNYDAKISAWWGYRLLFKDLWRADKKQDRDASAKPLQSIPQEVEGTPVVKTKVLHLFRSLGTRHIATSLLGKNHLSALVAFAIAAGWDQTSFMRRHFCGRALISVPDAWIDSLLPGVRNVLGEVQARNARLQSGKPQADDKVSDRAAEGFLQTALYCGICFWQNLPFRTQRYGLSHVLHKLPDVANIMLTQEYLEFAQQVMSSHDKANKQAEVDVSASMGEMLQDMQACLKHLCGSSAIQDPEAVAKLILDKVTAMNMSSDSMLKDSGKGLALPVVAAKQKVVLPDMLADAKRHKASLIQAPTLHDSSGSINTVALAWKEWCSGPAHRTIARRVLDIKAHRHMSLGERNSNLHKKNRHLPQLNEFLVGYGATADQAVNLMTQIAEHFRLSLDQIREGSRLLAGKTAKTDSDTVTAESLVTLGDFKAAVGWAYSAIAQ